MLEAENEQLKSDSQALASKNQALETDLSAANDTIRALELKIAQLEEARPAAANAAPAALEEALAKNRALAAEMKELRTDYRKLYESALLVEKDRDRLHAELEKELENPSAPGGTFRRVVGVVKFAETASTGDEHWNYGELRRLVTDLVQTMLPKQANRAEFDRKVQEINGPLFDLCSKIIDHRTVRKCQDGLLQQGLPEPATKKRRGGGGADRGSGGGGYGGGGYEYGFF